MIPDHKADSGDFQSRIEEDIEASERELKDLAYTGLFLVAVLTLGVAGICWVVW